MISVSYEPNNMYTMRDSLIVESITNSSKKKKKEKKRNRLFWEKGGKNINKQTKKVKISVKPKQSKTRQVFFFFLIAEIARLWPYPLLHDSTISFPTLIAILCSYQRSLIVLLIQVKISFFLVLPLFLVLYIWILFFSLFFFSFFFGK